MYKGYLEDIFTTLDQIELHQDGEVLFGYEQIIAKIVSTFEGIKKTHNKVFFIGNGGSAAIASHMTADFMKNGGMKTYNLFENSVTICMGNDYGYEYVLGKPLDLLGDEGDLLVAISSSGKSYNIIMAVDAARKTK